MSWKPPIINKKEDEISRTIRTEEIDFDDFIKKTSNVVVVNKDSFVCPECNEGWTFSRMKTIQCCGITYVRNI